MFNKEDMMVSLVKAEEKIQYVKDDCSIKLIKQMEIANHFIDSMKENYPIQISLKLNDIQYEIGNSTPLIDTNGFRVYTGDEVRLNVRSMGGKLGFIICTHEGVYIFITNDGPLIIPDSALRNTVIDEQSNMKFCTITRHFNSYREGEEIAKGRRGGEGAYVIYLK